MVGTNPKFDALLTKMSEMHEKKAADYSHAGDRYSNFREAAVAAQTDISTVFKVLMGIKMARLNELEGMGKKPNNESIQDSRLDLAVYAALYASYFMEG